MAIESSYPVKLGSQKAAGLTFKNFMAHACAGRTGQVSFVEVDRLRRSSLNILSICGETFFRVPNVV